MATARRPGKSARAPAPAAAVAAPRRLLPWLLGLSLFIQPLLLDLNATDEYETLKLIFLRCAAMLLAAAWLRDAWRAGVARPWAWRLLPLAAFLVVTLLSTLTSTSPLTSALGEYGSYAGLQSQVFYLMVALAAYSLTSLAELRLALLLVLLGVVPSTGMALLESAGYEIGTLFGMTAEIPAHQTSGFFGNPNYFAGYTVSILPLCVYFARDARRWVQAVAWVAGVASGVAVVLSGSRTGIGFLFVLFAWLVVHVWWIVRRQLPEASSSPSALVAAVRRRWALVGAAVVVVVTTGALLAGPQLARVGRSLARPLHSLAADRLDLWQAGLGIAAEHPLLGSGPDTYAVEAPQHYPPSVYKRLGGNVTARRAHNEAINMLACMGGLGLLCWLWLYGGAVWRGARVVRRDDDAGRRELAMCLAASLTAGAGFNLLHFVVIGQAPWQFALVGALLALDRLAAQAAPSTPGETTTAARPASTWRLPAGPARLGIALALVSCALLGWDGLRWIQAEHALKNSYVAGLRNQLFKARDHADQAVALRPHERRYLEAQAQLRLRTARSADDRARTRQSLQGALDLARSPLGLWILLTLEKQLEDAEAVARVAREAVDRDPTRPGELNAAVRWLLGRGHAEPALGLLEQALAADPEAVGGIALELAAVLAEQGGTPSAQAAGWLDTARKLAGIALQVPSTRERAQALLGRLGQG